MRRGICGMVLCLLLAGAALVAIQGAAEVPAWSFAVIADPHLDQNRRYEPTAMAKFRRVLDLARRQKPRPDFVLILGDIHASHLAEALKGTRLPVHVLIGNHEQAADRKLLRALYPNDFQGKDFYAFEHKGSQFIMLCTAAPDDHVGHLESQFITPIVGQGEWLAEQLAQRSRFRHSFVCGHIPPEAQCRPNGMCLSQNVSRYLHTLVKQYHPTALFFGHRHIRIEFAIGGVPVYGCPSTNWNYGKHRAGFYFVSLLRDRADVRFVEVPMK